MRNSLMIGLALVWVGCEMPQPSTPDSEETPNGSLVTAPGEPTGPLPGKVAVPVEPDWDLSCGAGRLAEIRKGLVGNWSGTVTTPWVPRYPIELAFRRDGTYSARNPEAVADMPGTQPALYYGTDEDHPLKTWLVDDVKTGGEATGEINIVFGLVYTTTRDELRHLKLSRDGKRLSFEMWHFGTYGPVAVELQRR